MSGEICLITGGAGFIGTRLGPFLADSFSTLVAFDNFHPQVHPLHPVHTLPEVPWQVVRGDVADIDGWRDLLERFTPDVIVHLAAETGTGQSLERPSLHTGTNVQGVGVMLEALNEARIRPRRIVLASSRAVYGEGAWRRRSDGAVWNPAQRTLADLRAGRWDFPDSDPLPMSAGTVPERPVSVYGATKLAQEHLIRAWTVASGSELVTLRFQNVYGEGQSLTNSYTGILSLFCRIARSGGVIPLYEDGRMLRDFVHVDDVARSVAAAISAREYSVMPIDIGSGEPTTIESAARAIATHFGAPDPIVTGQFRGGDVRHAFADVAAARDLLGWSAEVMVPDGLVRLATWVDETLTREEAEPSELGVRAPGA